MQIIDDMHAALTSDQCNIVVQAMAKSHTTRYWLSAGQKPRKQVLGIEDASKPATLTRFINDANRELPADSTAVVLRAHATGLDNIHDYPAMTGGGLGGNDLVQAAASPADPVALGNLFGGYGRVEEPGQPERYGCRWGPDPNTNHYLTNVSMKKAIAATRDTRVQLLGLNACWMATLEIEYELRSVADVIVASQVYAKPWPYGAIAKALCNAPEQTAEELARNIVASVKSDIARGTRRDAVSAFRS